MMRQNTRGLRPLAGVLLSGAILLLGVACGGGGQAPTGDAEPTPAAPAEPAAGPTLSKGTASVTGTVTYEGQVPQFQPIQMDADPQCVEKHTEPVYPQALELGEGQTMAHVYVKVTSGLPEGSWAVPSEPAVIDQRGCIYHPHVLGVMAGQTLEFKNSDAILHNVHLLPDENREANIGMPATVTSKTMTLGDPEEPFHIKCDVHPWMSAYVGVTDHPFFAVTGTDGTYTISGLPAGTYTIEAWHERLGTQTAEVTVADGETATADFTMAVPGS